MKALKRVNGRRKHRIKRHLDFKGIAVIELAISLPVLVLFIASFLQLTNMFFLRQKATFAGFVGMQQLAQADANETSVRTTVLDLLKSRGITGASVSITPSGLLDSGPRGQEFKLSITVPIQKNLPAPKVLPAGGVIQVDYSLYR